MKISELATKTGVSARSLRYYEQQGLITAQRRANGYREYDDEAVATVLTIRSLLDLGFPSDLIRTVMPCTKGETQEDICGGVLQRVEAIRDEVAERVVQMRRTQETLTRYLDEARA